MARPAKSGSTYTNDDKRRAVMVWVMSGNMTDVSRKTGIPQTTLSYWRRHAEWWDSLVAEIRTEKNGELDAAYTKIIHDISEEIKDRVLHGDYVLNKDGTISRKPVNMKDLAVAGAVLFDKRALNRGDPTSRTERTTTDAQLTKLADAFKAASKGKPLPQPADTDKADDSAPLH